MGYFGSFLPLVWFRLAVLVLMEGYLLVERMWLMAVFVAGFIALTVAQIYTIKKNTH